MFLIDDVLLRAVGVSIPGYDLMWTLERIGELAHRTMRDQIRDRIKENAMLFELGERSLEEFNARNRTLVCQMRATERRMQGSDTIIKTMG